MLIITEAIMSSSSNGLNVFLLAMPLRFGGTGSFMQDESAPSPSTHEWRCTEKSQ